MANFVSATSGGLYNGSGTRVCIGQLGWERSESATAVSYTLGVYIYCERYGYSTSGVLSTSLSCSGQTPRSTSGGSCDLSAGGRARLSGNWTYTFTKGETAYTRAIGFSLTSTGASVSGTSSGSYTVSIPALASYQVSYDANGGTGSGSQTKYYGKNLTLSSGIGFTRANHTLTGWNTAKDGSGTAYALGATYTVNSPLTLYAQWHMDYIKPTITNAQAYRVSSSSSSTPADDGTYIYISFSYTGGKYPTDIEYTPPDYIIKINGVSPTGASGTLPEPSGSWPTSTIAYGLYATNESHSIEIKLSDSVDTEGTTETLTVGLPMYPIDLRIDSNNQTYMGIMTAAQSGKTLSMPLINVTGISINNLEMIDFIVEEGEQAVISEGGSPPYNFGDGYWRWREWNSGKVEIWYYGSVLLDRTGGTGQVAGLYRYLRRITFPNNYALDKCIGIVNGTTGGNWLNCGGLFKVKNGTDVHEEPFTKIEVMAYCITARPSQNQENTSIYICGEKHV